MRSKQQKVADLVASLEDRGLNPYYAGYFNYFNRALYYEAHDVLEQLWLADRHGPNGAFYKGLIQLAGAFVHLQKNRLRPAAALFKLARANLAQYPPFHERLAINTVLAMIDHWIGRLEESDFAMNPLAPDHAPMLAPDPPRDQPQPTTKGIGTR